MMNLHVGHGQNHGHFRSIVKPIPPKEPIITRQTFEEARDLAVAAELGRTLLERNEELENDIKQQQAIIEDQTQEIEFLAKQVHSMKEETTSRSKFYEQLETTLFDLERTNTQLTRKRETDMKRIQSLCENIDYLERKCEEMTGTLESMRGDSKKSARAHGISRNSYLSYSPSDSSEDDSFYMSRRRSHSLQDLRDYSSSPDDLDSHHSSNSPDLKGSEHEFIESLETKIEELLTARKKESEKMSDLEDKMRVLITENDNLQEKLNEVQNEKDSQIRNLQRQLLDCSNYVQLPTTSHSEGKSVSTPTSLIMSEDMDAHDSPQSLLYGFANSETSGVSSDEGSVDRSCSKSPYAICKRCSTEIKVRNLVNSIEEEDSGEFSSLENELAKATAGETLEEEMGATVWDTSFQALTTRLVDAGVQTEENAKIQEAESDSELAVKQTVFVDYDFQDALEEGEEACEVPVDGVVKRRSLPAKLEQPGKKRTKKAKATKQDSKKNEALILRRESVAFEEEPAELDFNYPVTKKTGLVQPVSGSGGELLVMPAVTVYLTPVPDEETSVENEDGPPPEYQEIFSKLFRLFEDTKRSRCQA